MAHGEVVRRQGIPLELGSAFLVGTTKAARVSERRLRADDLLRPAKGVRLLRPLVMNRAASLTHCEPFNWCCRSTWPSHM